MSRLSGIVSRCVALPDWQLALLTMMWVVAGGLVLQLIVLPQLLPQVHWGHGLITDLDSLGYHVYAVEQAERIRRSGWSEWELRPMGHMTSGLAGALYRVVAPEPWVMLPINGAVFAAAVVGARRIVRLLFDDATVAALAIVPFFAFPSFVPIWGQLQKDVFSGAGFVLVLLALVAACHGRRSAAALTAGFALVWLARPYLMLVVAAAAFVGAAVAAIADRRARRTLLQLMGAMAVVVVVGVQPWQLNGVPIARRTLDRTNTGEPVPPSPDVVSDGLHPIDPAKAYAPCLPVPGAGLVDRMLFTLCTVRQGYIATGGRVAAGSGFDYSVRVRTPAEFVRYVPRALMVAIVEPGPWRWGTYKSPVGRLAAPFIPLEMLAAYVAWLLALTLNPAGLRRVDVWVIIVCCLFYTLCFTYAMPQLGTLYRMRLFAFAMLVSVAIGVARDGSRRPSAGPAQ